MERVGGAEGTLEKEIERLNSLLRAEISAVEVYKQAIEKAGDRRSSEATQLRAIAQEHGESAQRIRDHVRRLGGEPDDSSGTSGIYSKVLQGVADLFGDASALKALREGEEHGLKDYREALTEVDEPARSLISEYLIPAQLRHISMLSGVINRI